MTLRCHLFGHRRSRSRATFDEKHGRWISECKRCFVPLVRAPNKTWHPAPEVSTGRLKPVEREPEQSAPAGRRPDEAPLAATAAADSAYRGGSSLGQRGEQSVELSAS